MSKPTIFFVPGSYCLPSMYQPIFDGVAKAGFEVHSIHLPTVGPSAGQGRAEPAHSMYDDAAAIATQVQKLVDQGKDVIITGHSYAGVPMTQCTKGLGKAERTASGKQGGVIELAYLAPLLPLIGDSAKALIDTMPKESTMSVEVDENGWMILNDPAATARALASELPPEEGEAVIRSFAKHSARSFGDPLTYAGYMDIPASFLFCEEDTAGPPKFQQAWIDAVERVSGRKIEVTKIKAGHMMNFHNEQDLIDFLVSRARKAEGRGD